MQSDLEAHRARVTEIDAEIARHKQCIAELLSQRTIACNALGAYKYPVLELPNEIISEIFLHLLPPSPICPPLTGLYSPTILTHICSKWRAIALSTPDLWTAILVSKSQEEKDHIANAWLTRSRTRFLTVEIHGQIEEDISHEMFLAIMLQRARLERLTIRTPGYDNDHIKGPMPRLRHLHFDFWRCSDSEYLELDNAPLLRSVTLSRQAVYLVEVPWTQLTSLTLNCTFPSDCTSVLEDVPNLVECELLLFVRGDDPLRLVQLPRLMSLIVRGYEEPGEDVMIRSLITPAICTLEVSEQQLGEDPLETLAHFFSQSGCKLEDLLLCITQYEGEVPPDYSEYSMKFPTISKIIPRFRRHEDDDD
ncbi:F-box domain-containing protein [Favolaschia claudopus]|uniref:F-box domain-containing protein n=1 Tax=Favolaschia claudopus TaxID=2862362 RepID=A0AAW0AXD0_9AGAR